MSKEYMQKKLRLLYIRTGLDILWALIAIASLVWLFTYPEIFSQ